MPFHVVPFIDFLTPKPEWEAGEAEVAELGIDPLLVEQMQVHQSGKNAGYMARA